MSKLDETLAKQVALHTRVVLALEHDSKERAISVVLSHMSFEHIEAMLENIEGFRRVSDFIASETE